jgi:glutaredoxin
MMKTYSILIPLVMTLACGSANAQQMYKWIGKDGKINYTDTPPPAFAKQSEIKAVTGGGPDTSNLPYELAQAAKSNPVTLYTGSDCAPCDSGRALLTARGIPFSEKTVRTAEDGEQLKQVGGAGTLPLLVVGRTKQTGFEATGWGTALTVAGYPETSKLPASYRNPVAEAAAPKVVKETAPAKKKSEPAPVVLPDNASPSGIRF